MTRTLIGCQPSSANGRTAKMGFDPIFYGTAVTTQRQVGSGNGNDATEWWKPAT